MRACVSSKRGLWLSLAVAVAAMAFFFGPTDNWVWDASIYYAQIRSPIIDHDVNFRNEIVTNGIVLQGTATGMVEAAHPIGPALLWAPFFILAHILTLLVAPQLATGYSPLYIALVSFGSVLYGLGGIWLLYRIGCHFGESRSAAIVALLSFFATPLFFYTFRQPIISHTTNIFVASLMLWAYISLEKERAVHKWSGLLFGTLAGLAFLTRWTGALLLLYPLSYFLSRLVEAGRRGDRESLRRIVQQLAVATAVGLVVVSPQIMLWRRIYGAYLAFPQMKSVFLVDSSWPINLDDIFFNTSRGLLFWAPFTVWGMLGLFWIPDRRLRWLSIFYVALLAITVGYRVDWYSGGAVGQRYVIELLPVLAMGAICSIQWLLRKGVSFRLIATGASLLVIQQAILVFSVERSHSGWLDVANYFTGRPIGVAWFFTNTSRLLRDPTLWFSPRPYVALDRQTLVANLLQGVTELPAYYIAGLGLLFAVVTVLSWPLLMRIPRPRTEHLLRAVPLYMMGWALFLFFVGR